eukprot:IDg21804t1
MELQEKGMDLLYCRTQFEALLQDPKYGCMGCYLDTRAAIVASPDFESGCVKIMEGRRLNHVEVKACAKLRKQPAYIAGEAPNRAAKMSTEERLQMNRKRRKLSSCGEEDTTHSSDYMDVSKIVCATSNCCERLFSEAKYIIVPHRRAMSPILFEALLF